MIAPFLPVRSPQSKGQSESSISSARTLDGKTILRFVRAFRFGAGMEYDVEAANRSLCKRYELTIINIHLAAPDGSSRPEIEDSGRGRIFHLPVRRRCTRLGTPTEAPRAAGGVRHASKRLVCSIPLFRLAWSRLWRRLGPRPKPGEAIGVREAVAAAIREHDVNLVMVHADGGRDAWEAIAQAKSDGKPVGMQLHYSNERFNHLSMRAQASMIAGVAGVSDIGVPRHIASRFVNLGTAVDLTFFSRSSAGVALSEKGSGALVIALPARIVRSKGHTDLVRAVTQLKGKGWNVRVVFAGRADDLDYASELREAIRQAGLGEEFEFAGLLDPEGIRSLLARSAILAFPTYHDEGNPRILLEAQAMEVPPVVYDTGGARAGLLEGQTGFVVPKGDVGALAESISRLLQDEVLRRQMGAFGRRHVEQVSSFDALAERHAAFYLGMIDVWQSGRK